MSQRTYPVPQTDPPRSPRETLPTMYDLPCEDPEEDGLPDEYHDLQPQLLSETLRLSHYSRDQIFTGTDLYLYYDVRHAQWYKRPDWFLVLGVPRLYDEVDLRRSYVMWQEGISPYVVVELLSPGTEREDLGEYAESAETGKPLPPVTQLDPQPGAATDNGCKATPPRKWEVYERILRVPYYVVFSRYTNRFRCFHLMGGHYQEQVLDPDCPRCWIPELQLGIGVWQGDYDGVVRPWLRWYDEQGNWIPTSAERMERAYQEQQQALHQIELERQEKQQALHQMEQAKAQLRQTASALLQQGMSVEQVARLMSMSESELQDLLKRE